MAHGDGEPLLVCGERRLRPDVEQREVGELARLRVHKREPKAGQAQFEAHTQLGRHSSLDGGRLELLLLQTAREGQLAEWPVRAAQADGRLQVWQRLALRSLVARTRGRAHRPARTPPHLAPPARRAHNRHDSYPGRSHPGGS
jgi:hypothetical protein